MLLACSMVCSSPVEQLLGAHAAPPPPPLEPFPCPALRACIGRRACSPLPMSAPSGGSTLGTISATLVKVFSTTRPTTWE